MGWAGVGWGGGPALPRHRMGVRNGSQWKGKELKERGAKAGERRWEVLSCPLSLVLEPP